MSKNQQHVLKDTTQESTSESFSHSSNNQGNRRYNNRRQPRNFSQSTAEDGSAVTSSSTAAAPTDEQPRSNNRRKPQHGRRHPRNTNYAAGEAGPSDGSSGVVSAKTVPMSTPSAAAPVAPVALDAPADYERGGVERPSNANKHSDEVRKLSPTKLSLSGNKAGAGGVLSKFIPSSTGPAQKHAPIQHQQQQQQQQHQQPPQQQYQQQYQHQQQQHPQQQQQQQQQPQYEPREIGRAFPDVQSHRQQHQQQQYQPYSHQQQYQGPDNRGGYQQSGGRPMRDRREFSGSGPRSNGAPHHRTRHIVSNRIDPKTEYELFGEARTGIDFAVYENIPAKATGKNTPQSIVSFDEVEFSHEIIRENLHKCGYEQPTPIQKFSLPIAMAGRDMIACAQTGSGKTAAFLIPIIHLLLGRDIPEPPATNSYRRPACPQALVLGPTRELVTQIHKEALKFTYRTSIKPVVVYGGTSVVDQMRQLSHGCDIIVATPGRLFDFCSRGSVLLANINILVLDEADRMLDMGFAPQIRDIVYKFDMPQENVQTLMFSATFPPEIQRLAQEFLDDYVYITIGRVGSSTDLITQKVLLCPSRESDKREALMEVLSDLDGLALVFVETKKSADVLEDFLNDNSIDAASIHGDRSQYEREQALNFFRSGRCPVLVATDVAARGLSIPNVRYVVNYDMPQNIDDYVHRIGRTGRCGEKGTAFSFVGEKNRTIITDLISNMDEAKQDIPEFLHQLGSSRSSGGPSAGGRGGYNRGYGGGGNRSYGRNTNQDYRYTSQYNNNSNASSFSRGPAPKTAYAAHFANDAW